MLRRLLVAIGFYLLGYGAFYQMPGSLCQFRSHEFTGKTNKTLQTKPPTVTDALRCVGPDSDSPTPRLDPPVRPVRTGAPKIVRRSLRTLLDVEGTSPQALLDGWEKALAEMESNSEATSTSGLK